MFDVVFSFHPGLIMQQWDFLLTNFGVTPDRAWVRDYDKANYLGHYTQLFDSSKLMDRPIVIVQPPNGVYIAGEESLIDFNHPEDAVYIFGNDYKHLTEEMLEGLVSDHTVYVPQSTHHDMYAITAASCVFYDRMVKSG